MDTRGRGGTVRHNFLSMMREGGKCIRMVGGSVVKDSAVTTPP